MTLQPAAALRAGWQFALQPGRWLPSLLLTVLIGAASVLAGMMIAVGNVMAAALLSGALLGIVGLLLPLRWLLAGMVLLVFVIVGQMIYFAGFGRAFWFPYLLSLLLYLRLLGLQLQRRVGSPPSGQPVSAVSFWLGLFLACAVVASLTHAIPPLQWFVTGKEYFLLWAVTLCLVARVVEPGWVPALTRWLPAFLLLQVPVVLYQRFVVAPSRSGASVFDAVVGLFGGDPEGGGASGAMALFSMFVIALAIEGRRAGHYTAARAWLLIALAAMPVVFGEVKVVGLLLPLLLLILNGRRLMRYPLRSVMGVLSGIFAIVALAWLYQTQFSYTTSQRERTLTEYVEKIVERQMGGPLVSVHGEMGRIPAITYWWDRQGSELGPEAWIGQGVGATRVGSLVLGDAVREHRLRLGRSTLAVLLWEVGLIGTLAAVMLLSSSGLLAWRLAKRPAFASQAWFLRATAVLMALILVTFPYNTDFIETTPIKLLVALLIGYLLALRRSDPARA